MAKRHTRRFCRFTKRRVFYSYRFDDLVQAHSLIRAARATICLCVFLSLPPLLFAERFPDSFFEFRDAVYAQVSERARITQFYARAKEDVESSLAGLELYLALARCEYLAGISIRAEGKKSEAVPFFEKGIAWAEKSIELCPTSEGHRLLGTNMAFLSESRISYGLMNFPRLVENIKKAVELDPGNLTAQHLAAALQVLAPWPFGSTRKGKALLDAITAQNYLDMEKEDLFNLYLIFEVACLKQKKNEEAKFWSDRAKAIYPTNNFIQLLDRWGFIDGDPYGTAVKIGDIK